MAENDSGDWIDITEQFRSAAQGLPLGGLLHEESFGLGEAMNAVEMMDPKMDAYCESNLVGRKIRSFPEAVKLDHLKVDSFSTSEQLGIIDELLACFATWLNGNNLAQTIFTCLYVHDLSAVKDPIIKAACVGVLKCCAYIREVLVAASVHDDDDQQTSLYAGFDLLRELPDKRALATLKDVEMDVSRQIRHIVNDKGQGSPFSGAHACSGATAENLDQVRSILCRVRFIKHLLNFCVQAENQQDEHRLEAKKSLKSAIELLPDLKKSLDFGITRCEGCPKKAVMLGFEPLLNQRLLPPSPRQPAIMTRADALSFFSALFPQLLSTVEFMALPSLLACMDFFWQFSWRSPLPFNVSRSYLLHLFFTVDMKKAEQRLRDSCRAFCSAPSLNPKVSISSKADVVVLLREFFGSAGAAIDEAFHVLCMQRSWHRQKLISVMNRLSTLQDQAEQVDLTFTHLLMTSDPEYRHNEYFSAYVLWLILPLLIHYVLLPFELELYSIDEYHYAYWYAEYLFDWMANCYKLAGELQKRSDMAGVKGSKKVKTSKKVDREKESQIAIMLGKLNLSRGILRVIEAQHCLGKMSKMFYPFGSEKTRFAHRFQIFNTFDRPQPMAYEQYLDRSKLESLKPEDADGRMAQALEAFTAACGALEKAPQDHMEVPSLLKVAKTNTVVCKLLSSGHKRDSKDAPQFDFSTHRHFPVIRPR